MTDDQLSLLDLPAARAARDDGVEIPLTQGKVALVSDSDYEWLSQQKWCTHKSATGLYYAVAHIPGSGKKGRVQLMHRAILAVTNPSHLVDHINHDGLDNRRNNLRIATVAENGMNRRSLQRNNTSGYCGVSWIKGAWRARIRVAGRYIHLGRFKDPQMAARAYDQAAIEHFGQFAHTNEAMGLLTPRGDQ